MKKTALLVVSLLVAGCSGAQPTAADAEPTSGAAKPTLDIVARLDAPPGNIALTPDGRRFVSMHPFGNPEFKVLELLNDGKTRPFPSAEWARTPSGGEAGMRSVIGIRADSRGVVWMLDLGGDGSPSRLIGWNTKLDRLEKIITVAADVTRPNSFFQDFALDSTHGVAFVADTTRGDLFGPSNPAIVVIDLATGSARRVLSDHPSFSPDGTPMIIDGTPVTGPRPDGSRGELQLGLNPITIDARDEWVYFGAMHGRSIHRVKTGALLDPTLSKDALAAGVERVGAKGLSDGITIDTAGNVYVTDETQHAIGVLRAGGGYELYITDAEALQWIDGLGAGPDGYIYATVNQLHRMALLHGGTDETRPPYLIARFQPLSPPVLGR